MMFRVRQKKRLGLYGLCLGLVACGGHDAASSTVTGSTTSLEPFVEQMEMQGQYPRLDRSASRRGLDHDANGIRDDIDQLLETMNLSPLERQSAQAVAASLQSIQTSELTVASAAMLSKASATVDACLLQVYGADAAFVLFKRLEAYTANTKARAEHYDHYNALRNGQVGHLLQETMCDEVLYAP